MVELRELKSVDLFPMVQILNKIGFNKIKEIMTPEKIKDMMKIFNAEDDQEDDQEDDLDVSTILGFNLIVEVAGLIMENLSCCENEIYRFLSGLSGLSVDQIKDLSLPDFADMIVSVLKKPEFPDFFKAVSKLFK